jgi:hypothetical protein
MRRERGLEAMGRVSDPPFHAASSPPRISYLHGRVGFVTVGTVQTVYVRQYSMPPIECDRAYVENRRADSEVKVVSRERISLEGGEFPLNAGAVMT